MNGGEVPTESVFVDTRGFISAYVEDDPHSEEGSAFLAAVRRGERFRRVFTSQYVLSEFATAILYGVGHEAACTALDELLSSETLNALSVDAGTFTAAWEVFRRYDDQRISFVDATSAVLAREAGIRHVFGYDSDFATLGFTRVPAPRR